MHAIVKTILFSVMLVILVVGVLALGLALDMLSQDQFVEASVSTLTITAVIAVTTVLIQVLASYSDKK